MKTFSCSSLLQEFLNKGTHQVGTLTVKCLTITMMDYAQTMCYLAAKGTVSTKRLIGK